ncbi:MAG: undecaprenyl-phosphate glucose phosphotransferase [Rhodospirillales bacterium]|nr:undecaprenyl-phosphate glucose phosphotransferase [Rhodospirillales bacterium]
MVREHRLRSGWRCRCFCAGACWSVLLSADTGLELCNLSDLLYRNRHQRRPDAKRLSLRRTLRLQHHRFVAQSYASDGVAECSGYIDPFDACTRAAHIGPVFPDVVLRKLSHLVGPHLWPAGRRQAADPSAGLGGSSGAQRRHRRRQRPGAASGFAAALEDAPWKRIVGIFDDRRTRISREVNGFPVLGNLDDLVRYVRSGKIHDVVITLPWSADDRLVNIIGKLRALPVHIYLGSDLIGYHFPRHREQLLEGVPVLEIASAPLTGWSGLIKKIEDRTVGTSLVVLLSPLLLLIALAIRLDSPGPILFRQKRYGFNNQEIVVYKFRSMHHNRPREEGVPQATKNDPRVTRVGRILRSTSLDELPQLFNVLQGNMSMVGPRPHAVEHNEQYAQLIGGYHGRHRVKPGITGWAQINGFRGETDTVEKMRGRVEHDVFYIENWSLWFDLKIMMLTAFAGWTHKNAY